MPLTDNSLLEESFVFKTVSKKLDMSLDEIQAERKQLETNNKKQQKRVQQKRKNNNNSNNNNNNKKSVKKDDSKVHWCFV